MCKLATIAFRTSGIGTMELASYQLSPLERLLLGGRRDPWRGEGAPEPFFACGFGFAAAVGFGTALTLESI